MTTKIEIHDIVCGTVTIATDSILTVEKNMMGFPEGAKTMITCKPQKDDDLEIFYHVTETLDKVKAMIDHAKELSHETL